jgi:hypothetical protein
MAALYLNRRVMQVLRLAAPDMALEKARLP